MKTFPITSTDLLQMAEQKPEDKAGAKEKAVELSASRSTIYR